jgi:uncharacterized protein (DUF1499 family)
LVRSSGTERLLTGATLILACTAALLLVAAGAGSHAGLWHFRTGFAMLKYGAWSGLAAAITGGAALLLPFRHRTRITAILATLAIIIGITSFAIPYTWKQTAARLPKIHDISTDTANPPAFVAILPLRKDAPNPSEYGGATVAANQAQAYPDIKPMLLDLPPEQAFKMALDAAKRLDWKIIATAPVEGRIEASDTTFWFGFTDDIIMRIGPAGAGSRLDIRSVSRVGLSDVGANARRIRKFFAMLKR